MYKKSDDFRAMKTRATKGYVINCIYPTNTDAAKENMLEDPRKRN